MTYARITNFGLICNEAFAGPSPFSAIRPVWGVPRLGRYATKHGNRSSRSPVRGGDLGATPARPRAMRGTRRSTGGFVWPRTARVRLEVPAAYWRAARSISVLGGMSAQPWYAPNQPDGGERRRSRECFVKGQYKGELAIHKT